MSNFAIVSSPIAPLSTFHRSSHFPGESPSSSSSSSSFFSDLHLPFPRFDHQRSNCKKVRICTVLCAAVKVKEYSSLASDAFMKEPHKYFDHVIISVRAGDGGHGAIFKMPNQKASSKVENKYDKVEKRKKISYKRDSDGSLILPLGGHGGDVVIYADESKDTLLEFHKQNRYKAKRGGNVDAMGVLNSKQRDGSAAPTLRIPVPLGTVVKRKRGKLLADLANHGDEVLVARGGQGGISLLEMPEQKKSMMAALTTNILRDDSDKVLVLGQAGEEVSLELILRVVADVGLVGLPNAGKSTLLSATTLAKPDIADYPFTTLMPNLGRLDGDPSLGAAMYSSEATLADLPGLIEGAHLGKGLGRNFLRHLRRTRLLVHVVDAAAEDPVKDYRTVKEELRMYNPDYLERPFIVVLNKIDLPQAKDRLPTLTEEILKIGQDCGSTPLVLGASSEDTAHTKADDTIPSASEINKRDKEIEDYPRPLAVVGVSVLKGINVKVMLEEIRKALRKCRDTQEFPLEFQR
ncbi:probable GTP-binding protein OBGC2 [Chenopodium quinoa]|uniref:probable GTP-binding protein OBGC2 n=1 Tax=Chenopodium quinoa TaxID=63459 RepID=UPI000B784D54|nr:probable GTP-binding protein OBGC2 [Chenopodium quinoa]XP_021759881.1 probable GTP-binding protein OBGC2 [Chenopodium quinoa]XP_021759882.1 probable GTP-binding protein OBGC2 [Chenopodium quinoa]XP_021759883.1 probable GTP-binding protein OBGC2 [Chenopodium quinoa]XP_021759884.1 probable GTP-binding protein OBGC2 [Chenopodium quinoa]XP_021759885.1 probable GTP-binding protein OBGC2 [Chenopodium quinoa]